MKRVVAYALSASLFIMGSMSAFAAGEVVNKNENKTIDGDIHVNGRYEAGIEVTEAVATVNGDLTSDLGPGAKIKDSDVTINGDLSGAYHTVEITDSNVGSNVVVNGNINSADSGVLVNSNKGDTSLVINGDITVDKTNDDTDIWNWYLNTDGVAVCLNKADGDTFDLFVDGDITASTDKGIGMTLDINKTKTTVTVDGTISGTKNGIFLWLDNVMNDPDPMIPDITVWKIESSEGDPLQAGVDSIGETPKYREDYLEKVADTIDYIIRVNLPSGTTYDMQGTHDKNGYQVANEDEEITIAIVSSSVAFDSISGGAAKVVKNADGTYSIIVPRGGGVEITAVLNAIQTGATEVPVTYEDNVEEVTYEEPESIYVATEEPAVLGVTLDTLEEVEEEPVVLGARRSVRTVDMTAVLPVFCFMMSGITFLCSRKKDDDNVA